MIMGDRLKTMHLYIFHNTYICHFIHISLSTNKDNDNKHKISFNFIHDVVNCPRIGILVTFVRLTFGNTIFFYRIN